MQRALMHLLSPTRFQKQRCLAQGLQSRFDLHSKILLGVLAGVAPGLFFGESAGSLSVLGYLGDDGASALGRFSPSLNRAGELTQAVCEFLILAIVYGHQDQARSSMIMSRF